VPLLLFLFEFRQKYTPAVIFCSLQHPAVTVYQPFNFDTINLKM